MHPRHLQLPITLAYAKGAFTLRIAIGSSGQHANVLLDTGSSTLAVLPRAYDPTADSGRRATPWAQEVRYGEGAWAGPVLQAEIGFGADHPVLTTAPLALIETTAQNFRDADGILGLAYAGLNHAHDFTEYLGGQGIAPPTTWPWPFSAEESAPQTFKHLASQQPRVDLTPCFSTLAEHGIVHDRFAFAVQRALVHVLSDAADDHQLAADPLNHGLLLLGVGAERSDLYHRPLQSVRILHDLYYNANLIALRIGDGARIAAPPLQDQYLQGYASNAIIDSGSSFILLQHDLYQALLAAFAAHDPALPALISEFRQAFDTEHGLPNAAIDYAAWPPLRFWLEAEDGGEVELVCPPEAYWQPNALHAGECFFLLLDQLPQWPNQSILGLPLFCGRYVVFDRRVEGTGVVRFADLR
jgi:hypothetical protein